MTKPWNDEEVLTTIQKGLEKRDLLLQNQQLAKLDLHQQERLSKLHHELERRGTKIESSRKLINEKKKYLELIHAFMTHLGESKTLSDLIQTIAQDTKQVIYFDAVTLLTPDQKLRIPEKVPKNWVTDSRVCHPIFRHFLKKPKIIKSPNPLIRLYFPQSTKIQSALLFPLISTVGNKKKSVSMLHLGRTTATPFNKNDIKNLEEISGPLAVAINKILLLDVIQEGTRQWEQTFDAIEDPNTIIDTHYTIIKANKACEKFAKTHVKKIVWKKCYEVLAHRNAPCTNCSVKESLEKKGASLGHDIVEFQDKDIRTWSFPIVGKNKNIEYIVQYYKDLTQEKAIYRKLIQSEKMSAVGLLTNSVAHEINNPITGILGLSQVIKKEIPPSHTHYADIMEIEKGALRCKEIIENLLSFSKELGKWNIEKSVSRTFIDINEVIESTLKLVWFSSAKKLVNIKKNLSQNLPKIRAHFSELQQVFFNILNNAYQAIEREGNIEITTKDIHGNICISIHDTGCGIHPDNLSKIFEPFFTTKIQGKGTGLGLSISHDIIKKYKGTIEVESEVGKGSLFTVRIPSK